MTILISGMKFYGYHGCFEEEQTIGTHFVVDIALTTNNTKAVETDNIEDAINYVSVYELVRQVMNKPTHLLETLAGRIIQSVKSTFAEVENVRVKVCKLNPPLDNQTDYIAIELEG